MYPGSALQLNHEHGQWILDPGRADYCLDHTASNLEVPLNNPERKAETARVIGMDAGLNDNMRSSNLLCGIARIS